MAIVEGMRKSGGRRPRRDLDVAAALQRKCSTWNIFVPTAIPLHTKWCGDLVRCSWQELRLFDIPVV
jgi:hypothetical protein